MEQERKIEKLLKAYAKKRRVQAGDSFKLDPATRRTLHNEISRTAEPADDDDETVSLWELFQKNWVYLLGFAACVFVLATFFFASLNKATMGPASASVHNVKQIPASVQFGSGSGETGLQVAVRSKVIPPDKSEAGRETREPAQPSSQNIAGVITVTNSNLAMLTQPAALSDRSLVKSAAPTSDKLETAPTTAEAPPARGEFNAPAPAPEVAPPAPPAPVAPSAANGNLAVNSMPANSEQSWTPRDETFRNGTGGALQNPASQKDYVKTTALPSQSAAVLVSFQISQNGNSIRVVDQEGSVYTGSVEAEGYKNDVAPGGAGSFWAPQAEQNNSAAQNPGAPKAESPKLGQLDAGANAKKENNANVSPEAISSGLSSAAAEPQLPMQKYFFHVEGTNQTLGQSVVFAGTLLEDLSFAGETQQTFGMTANVAVGAAYAQQFMRSAMTNQPLRIEGIAIIDQTNKIQINATSVPAKSSLPLKVLK